MTIPENHQETNNQLINILYTDVKNLTSVLNCCTGPKCVSSINHTKDLSHVDDDCS